MINKHDLLINILVDAGTLIDNASNDDPNVQQYWDIWKTASELLNQNNK